MKRSTKIVLVLLGVALILLGLANWYFFKKNGTEPAPAEIIQPNVTPVPPPPVDKSKPADHYPINSITDEQAPVKPLPSLKVSDTALRNALAALFTEKTFLQFFYSNEIIRRLVVTIDNLPRENVAAQLIPLKPVGGQFLVKTDSNAQYIDPANFQRYAPYVEFVQNMDTKQIVSLYKYFYPLFQQQYKELGYPDGYFNDRLIAVMDYMINFSEVTEPAQVSQNHVLYQYVLPELESMSAGGKLLTRMGHDNTVKLKEKLKEIRAELVKGN